MVFKIFKLSTPYLQLKIGRGLLKIEITVTVTKMFVKKFFFYVEFLFLIGWYKTEKKVWFSNTY